MMNKISSFLQKISKYLKLASEETYKDLHAELFFNWIYGNNGNREIYGTIINKDPDFNLFTEKEFKDFNNVARTFELDHLDPVPVEEGENDDLGVSEFEDSLEEGGEDDDRWGDYFLEEEEPPKKKLIPLGEKPSDESIKEPKSLERLQPETKVVGLTREVPKTALDKIKKSLNYNPLDNTISLYSWSDLQLLKHIYRFNGQFIKSITLPYRVREEEVPSVISAVIMTSTMNHGLSDIKSKLIANIKHHKKDLMRQVQRGVSLDQEHGGGSGEKGFSLLDNLAADSDTGEDLDIEDALEEIPENLSEDLNQPTHKVFLNYDVASLFFKALNADNDLLGDVKKFLENYKNEISKVYSGGGRMTLDTVQKNIKTALEDPKFVETSNFRNTVPRIVGLHLFKLFLEEYTSAAAEKVGLNNLQGLIYDVTVNQPKLLRYKTDLSAHLPDRMSGGRKSPKLEKTLKEILKSSDVNKIQNLLSVIADLFRATKTDIPKLLGSYFESLDFALLNKEVDEKAKSLIRGIANKLQEDQ